MCNIYVVYHNWIVKTFSFSKIKTVETLISFGIFCHPSNEMLVNKRATEEFYLAYRREFNECVEQFCHQSYRFRIDR